MTCKGLVVELKASFRIHLQEPAFLQAAHVGIHATARIRKLHMNHQGHTVVRVNVISGPLVTRLMEEVLSGGLWETVLEESSTAGMLLPS